MVSFELLSVYSCEMNFLIVWSLLITLVTSTCFARVGESKAECGKYYGKSIKQASNTANKNDRWYYKKGDYLFELEYHEGVCVRVTYSREDKGVLDKEELRVFLAFNKSADKHTKWTPLAKDKWFTVNPNKKAEFDKGKLSIYDFDYTTANSKNNVKIQAAEAPSNNGSKIDLSVNRIPIIVFTGQSLSVAAPRAIEPYISTDIPQLIANHFGSGASPVTSVQTAVIKGDKMGSQWEFARLLNNANWNGGEFALANSGKGATPAFLWRDGQPRSVESLASINAIISAVNAKNPGKYAYVHSIIINQGQREAQTSVTWSGSWSLYIDRIIADYATEGHMIKSYVVEMSSVHSDRYGVENVQRIQNEMERLAVNVGDEDYRENVTLISTQGFTAADYNRDRVHHNHEGYNLMGVKIFNAFAAKNGINLVEDTRP